MEKLVVLIAVLLVGAGIAFSVEGQDALFFTSDKEIPLPENDCNEMEKLSAEAADTDQQRWTGTVAPGGAIAEKTDLPEMLIRAGEENDYVVLVEKSTQKLHVYDSSYNRIKTIAVTTGQNRGPKLQFNDKRTPEGVYFFTDVMEEKELFPEYGVMALTTDYPNPVDVANNKKGDGIWLHATNQPERPLKAYDTRGCVVAVNEDILEVAKYVNLETTPLVIVEKMAYASLSEISRERADIIDFLGKWEDSWENKRLDSYISAYSDRFRSRGMNLKGWKRYKERLNRRYKTLRVEIENPRIIRFDNYMVVAFSQRYESDFFLDTGIKKLYLNREAEGWKIVGEEWRGMPTENPGEIVDTYRQRVASRTKDKETATHSEDGGDHFVRFAESSL